MLAFCNLFLIALIKEVNVVHVWESIRSVAVALFCAEIVLAFEDMYGDLWFYNGEITIFMMFVDALAGRFLMCWAHV